MAISREKTSKGHIRYKVRVRDSAGKWYPQVTCYSVPEARQVEADLIKKRDQELALAQALPGLQVVTSANGQARISVKIETVDEFFDRWSRHRRASGRVSVGWQNTLDSLFRDYVKEVIGDLPMYLVQTDHIRDLMANLKPRTKRISELKAESRSKIYGLLQTMFNDAVEEYHIIPTNPVIKSVKPKIVKKERNYLKPEESWQLLKHVEDHWAGPAIWSMVLAALRISETQALRVKNVDFEKQYIFIESIFNRATKSFQDQTKNGTQPRIPLASALADYLRPRLDGRKPDDFVCTNSFGGMLNHCTFDDTLTRLCKEAGVPRMTPHELRHSCTELYVNAGASTEDIRRLLNHKTTATTLRYIHRTDERLLGIAAKLEQPK